MPANVGEMFYYGDVPWHKKGVKLNKPANAEEAILAGRLDWEVGMVGLETAEDPPSTAETRVAIIRKDRPKGHPERVLGVTHRGFKPLQNKEGIRIFDSIFGKGKRVYHTGGYLGSGEVVWVLAELPKVIQVAKKDKVKPYALFTNSHNGSIAIDFRLTTIRVVCQNTLSLALDDRDKKTFFKHAHQGNYEDLQLQVEAFFEGTLKAADELEAQFKLMMEKKFDDELAMEYIEKVYPLPQQPRNTQKNRRALGFYNAKLKKAQKARIKTAQLRLHGDGTNISGVKESLWGVFNAVLEYSDHYEKTKYDGISSSLFGSGAVLKRKAFNLAVDYLSAN